MSNNRFALIAVSVILAAACGNNDDNSNHKRNGNNSSGTGGVLTSGGQSGQGNTTSNGGTNETGGVDSSGASGGAMDAGNDVSNATDAPTGGKLTLSLDVTIDGDDGTVKATSITSAILLNTAGSAIASATISGGTAVFSLAGVAAGDYFINVNADADDLVPTRIDDPSIDVDQRVGQKLRSSFIGSLNSPVYRINTYSAGQGQVPAVKFSDGTSIVGEQPYVIATLDTPKVEFRVLGTAYLMSFTALSMMNHPSNGEAFDDWMLMTMGMDHHGDVFNSDGGVNQCGFCHQNVTNKPAVYSSINPADGWCYRCHNGTDGAGAGFLDSTK